MSDVTALFGRLIDHAALFPPASMPMDEAIAVDRRARASEHAWMLGRFIVPASKLAALPEDAPPLSVVLRGPDDLDAVAAAADAGRRVELVEGRVDPIPVPYEAYWEGVDPHTIDGAGAKIRCGGVTADAFPPADEVAAFVAACRDAGVRFKATAGLHHPIRHVDPATGFHMHGFLNLLAAAVFAHADGIGEAEIAALLAEEDPAAFAVDADGLTARGRRAGAAAIAAARAELFTAYGSCSFSEPVEDLTALGLI